MDRILIVDDTEMSRELLAELLEDKYEVVFARNGREALHILSIQMGSITAVLLDLLMPEMNGYEFLMEIRDRKWDSRFPVIVISGDDSESSKEICEELGVSHYICKPFRHREALAEIASAIKEYNERQNAT
ncbi:MAG: response regulator [Lachnospiraceae bacterium]|nr:response regulator [Lachnospiraceae bacterium]MBR6303150.1 response regulator [Lachnospiraceae bacterium]